MKIPQTTFLQGEEKCRDYGDFAREGVVILYDPDRTVKENVNVLADVPDSMFSVPAVRVVKKEVVSIGFLFAEDAVIYYFEQKNPIGQPVVPGSPEYREFVRKWMSPDKYDKLDRIFEKYKNLLTIHRKVYKLYYEYK